MRKVSILADSTCDLSEDLIEKYHIAIIPLHIHLGDEEYLDGKSITPEQIYEWSDKHKATPKTSTISPAEAGDFLKEHLSEAEEVVCFCISGDMSTCGSVLEMTAAELGMKERVYVVDSQSLSTGIGLQVIEAAMMAEQGKSARDIVENIMEMRPLVRASFVVDTWTYLHRGGRCSGLAAMAGSTFKLHPCISVINGKMQAGKKYRGKMEKVIHDYIEDLKLELQKARSNRVFITHSGCDIAIINSVKAQLMELNHFEDILVTRAGGVISSHCGPGTLGVLFITEFQCD